MVLFKWKDGTPDDEIRAIEEAFRAPLSKIPGIAQFEWGKNISVEGKNQGFTHCFLVTFENETAREKYLPHPDLGACADLMQPVLDKVCVVDYFPAASAGTTDTVGKLRHIVLFQFKDETSADKLREIETKFTSLPEDIREIAAFEWGPNNSPEGLNQGLTHCFLLTFKEQKDIETYLRHPAHREFGNMARPSIEQALVFDFISYA